MYEDDKKITLAGRLIVLTVICLAFFFAITYYCIGPIYSVWEQRLKGEAELARAEANRKIRVLEANAEQDASKSLAEAEVIRAEGVARANKIIGDSLANNEGYLRYLWIQSLKTNQKEVIYVPTEANLPILEANRLKNQIDKLSADE